AQRGDARGSGPALHQAPTAQATAGKAAPVVVRKARIAHRALLQTWGTHGARANGNAQARRRKPSARRRGGGKASIRAHLAQRYGCKTPPRRPGSAPSAGAATWPRPKVEGELPRWRGSP